MRTSVFHTIGIIILIALMVFTSFSSTIPGYLEKQDVKESVKDIKEIDLTDHIEAQHDDNGPENSLGNFEQIPIYLRTNEFTTFDTPPEIPDEFASPNFAVLSYEDKNDVFLFNENIEDYFIIQFSGPVEPEWKNAVNDYGIDLFYYIPKYAFVAFGELNLLPEIQNLEFVNWVGPMHPYYRVQPELMEKLTFDISNPMNAGQPVTISLRPINDMESLLGAIYSVGGIIAVVDSDNYVTCTISVSMAYQLIFTKNLLWMEFYTEPELLNNVYSRILDIRQATNGSYANNGQSLWSYNHNTDTFEGFPGNDVIIAVADTGVDGTHPTFDGKKIWFYDYGTNQENTWTDSGGTSPGHGTHTAGTSLGLGKWRSGDSGEAAKYSGMAPTAGLIGQAIFQGGTLNPTKICNDAVDHGGDISTNSWGWPGTAGNYDNTAVSYDELVRNSSGEEFMVVFATGNEGPGTIRSPATAKNVLSVGATDNNDGTSVVGFSSGGPTDDDRLKPDVVSPGQMVASAGYRNLGYGKPADGQNSYYYASGTSMACPGAAGAAAVVIDYINHTYGYEPSPALVKAIMINGADPIDGYTYPGMRQGWGRIDLANSLLEESDKRFFIINQNISMDTNDDQLYYFSTPATDAPIRITLAYTDVPGNPGSGKNLVNDLDLILESPDGKMYYGNYFQNDKSADNGEADEINNVEGIYIPNAPEGGWILTILASNVPQGPQDFALAIAGDIKDISKGYRDIEIKPSLQFPSKTHLEGDTIVLNGSFINNGTIPTINVRYRIIHVLPDLVEETLVDNTVPSMSVLNRHYVEYKWSAKRGDHTFKLVVDPFNTIREELEDNNLAVNSITIDHFGIETSILEDILTVQPGIKTKFTINIRNTGSLQDTYTVVSTTPPLGWETDLSENAIVIGSNMSQKAIFSVTPPSDALANDTVGLIVLIMSKGNMTYISEVTTKTIVEQYFEFHLEYETLSKAILPGIQGLYTVTINNTGNGLDSFTIGSTGGKYGWSWRVSDEFVDIPARGIYNVTLAVTPPEDGLADEDCKIQLYFVDSQMLLKEVEITSIIDKVYESRLEIVIPTNTADTGARIRFPLTAYNHGNIDDTYRFRTTVPKDWSANFSKSALDIASREFSRFYYEIKIPTGEMPDEYSLNITMESLDTNLIQEYTIALEVNQFYSIQAEILPIREKVYQGQDAQYELRVTNYGTGSDSVKIDYTSLPRHWRMNFDNNVLGLDLEGSNTTKVFINTDILAEDGSYETLLKIISAGNESVYVPVSVVTHVDHNMESPGDDGRNLNVTDDAFDLLGLSLMLLLMLMLVPLVILIIIIFMVIRFRKKKKVQSAEVDERMKVVQEEQAKKDEFKSLYSEDMSLQPRAARPQLGAPITVDYFESGRPPMPPSFTQSEQLPLGPIPVQTERPVDMGRRKKVPKRRAGEDHSMPQLPPIEPAEPQGAKKFDVFLPDDPGSSGEQSFQTITPEKTRDVEFDRKGPVFADSSPVEWESVDKGEIEKTFEFGSGPELVDGKKKKKID